MSTSSEPTKESDDEVDEEKLKGDAIGGTLYSEKWVIQTLMKLTQEFPKYAPEDSETSETMELDEELETDLCTLWDMTADPDVALCLQRHDIFSLIQHILENSRAPRLTEIVVGVLANMSCCAEISIKMAREENLIGLVIEYLLNDDIQTIVQCVRLLDTLLQSPDNQLIELVGSSSKIWPHLSFILKSSLNVELLCSTAKLCDVLTVHLELDDNRCPPHLPVSEILDGVLECIAQLRKEVDGELPEPVQTASDALISALYNLSRLSCMRQQMVERRDDVLELTLHCLEEQASRYEEDGIEPFRVAALTASSVQTATLFYVVNDSSRLGSMLQSSARIAAAMGNYCHTDETCRYAADFDETVGDCLRQSGRQLDVEQLLDGVLQPLSTAQLTYVFSVARRCAADDPLAELVAAARRSSSYRHLVDTLDHCDS